MPTYNNFAQTTVVTLYKNCPCDRDYQYTILFASLADQASYFSSLSKLALTNSDNMQSFQRATINSIRVNIPQWSVREYNYMCFNNGTAMGSKNYYCFIDRTEYINPNTTEIFYTEDVMQTWMFEYQLEECFVEREHSETDVAGDNLIDEGLELGEYESKDHRTGTNLPVTSWYKMMTDVQYDIVFACTFKIVVEGSGGAPSGYKTSNDVSVGSVYNGYFSGAIFYVFGRDYTNDLSDLMSSPNLTTFDIDNLPTFINTVVKSNKVDGVVSAYMIPKGFLDTPTAIGDNTSTASGQNTGVTANVYSNINDLKTGSSMYGFVPYNNKLFTYPYCMLYATNMQNITNEYRFELFDNPSTIQFKRIGSGMPDGGQIFYPLNYKGKASNYEEAITIEHYPAITFNIDAFKAWLAQNALPMVSSLVGTGLQSLAFGATDMKRTGTATAIRGIGQVMDVLGKVGQASKNPNLLGGNNSGSLRHMAGLNNVFYTVKHIMPQYAHIIDEYFQMYGYACHRVKVPNIHSRTYWNYVKTRNCHIESVTGVNYVRGIDAETKEKICSIYDNGITFWHYVTGMDIGNYNKANTIRSI